MWHHVLSVTKQESPEDVGVTKVNVERRAELGRRKRELTRTSIIERALEVVASKGFDAPTIDEFVAAAGVARGTFYNYFRTREMLLEAVAGRVVDELDLAITGLDTAIKDPAQRIVVALRHFLNMSKQRPVWGWLIVRMLPIKGGPLSEEMRRGVLADLRAGARTGRFFLESVETAVAFCMGVLVMSIRATLEGGVSANFATAMAAMTLRGLGVRPAEAARVASLPMPKLPASRPNAGGRSSRKGG
jgi:AcrR family transcriptional regulator